MKVVPDFSKNRIISFKENCKSGYLAVTDIRSDSDVCYPGPDAKLVFGTTVQYIEYIYIVTLALFLPIALYLSCLSVCLSSSVYLYK